MSLRAKQKISRRWFQLEHPGASSILAALEAQASFLWGLAREREGPQAGGASWASRT